MGGKSLLYEIGRWVVVIVALALLISMFGGESVSDADPAAVAAAVLGTVDSSNMLEADNQLIKRLYGLDPADYESVTCYYPATNMMAQELLIVKLTDVSQQEAVKAAIENRLATQKTTFDGYGVEQYDLLTNYSVVEIRGNWALFVVNETCADALAAFTDAL